MSHRSPAPSPPGSQSESDAGSAGQHALEVATGQRFEFGENWTAFLSGLSEERIQQAEQSLSMMLQTEDLSGCRFLDIGSGSGLFSLAARRLGAQVVSFDFDPKSVRCTESLRARFFPDGSGWRVLQGSVLDQDLIETLGTFDVVYSWGVLHHTGAMWQAMANAADLVAEGGRLYIAIYNHQVYWSAFYRGVKRAYVATPRGLRWVILAGFATVQVVKGFLKDVAFLRNPATRYRTKIRARGMSTFHDWVDWVGGYPFEVARPEEVFDFLRPRGFVLERLKTCGGGRGCNEFVFRRAPTLAG